MEYDFKFDRVIAKCKPYSRHVLAFAIWSLGQSRSNFIAQTTLSATVRFGLTLDRAENASVMYSYRVKYSNSILTEYGVLHTAYLTYSGLAVLLLPPPPT